jgi:LmbE family N-acetylglucosaminyl deacetylase
MQMHIKKLNVVGSVLYIAAHPDDENTQLIAYLANEALVQTAYLSLTRGDGGQNLIGPELNEALGVIRTQELLQARRVDGGKQFFSRAVDFGFSKNPDETFKIWNKEHLLSDVVWVIRKFRPDIIITSFSIEPGTTHGHHTASSILAHEAFDAAADKTRFPEQLVYVDVWQPKRLLWNTSAFVFQHENYTTEHKIKLDVGMFNPFLGKSYGEVAAESRSKHRSQGMGMGTTRGQAFEYLHAEKGHVPKKDMFEDIDLSWNRVEGASALTAIFNEAFHHYNPADPAASADILLKAKEILERLPDSYWKQVKLDELQEVIQNCLGIYVEAVTAAATACPGETIKIRIQIINRSKVPVELKKISYSHIHDETSYSIPLKYDIDKFINCNLNIPEDMPYSEPYWLKNQHSRGMFCIGEQLLIGLSENPPAIEVNYTVTVKDHSFIFKSPIIYKSTDPIRGEVQTAFFITPPVFLNIAEKLYVFNGNKSKVVRVKVTSGQENINGFLSLVVPDGWKFEPQAFSFHIHKKGDAKNFDFVVFPLARDLTDNIKGMATIGGNLYDKGLIKIEYDHIPVQMLFPDAKAKCLNLDFEKIGEQIGYVMGAGDNVHAALVQMGYKVTFLKQEDIHAGNLKKFDAVVLGIRAYNTINGFKLYKKALMEYVHNGGTLVVQYNTLPAFNSLHKNLLDSIGPYSFAVSNERVTEADADIRFLKPDHQVLNTPNKITQKDFEGWVHERGLCMPKAWGSEYEAILSSNDHGETPKDGGLLIARHGKGYYVYTTYAWFRQLPAGVPGAYRIFANIISLRNDQDA